MKITARDIAIAKNPDGPPSAEVRNKHYHNGRWARLREQAALNGISENAVKLRVYKYGWDEHRAVTEPMGTNVGSPKKKGHKPGDYAHWLVKAKSNGISKGTYDSRVYMYGWDEERAATEPVGSSTGRPKAK